MLLQFGSMGQITHTQKIGHSLETFSYEREEGRLLEALAEKIAPFETLTPDHERRCLI
jgi:hypothetical protein